MSTRNLELNDYEYESSEEDVSSFTEHSLLAEEKIRGDDVYILHTTATLDSNFNVALGLSNHNCEVYHFDGSRLVNLDVGVAHSDSIIGCKFSSSDNNLLYTGSKDGSVKLWDLRLSKKLVSEFQDIVAEDSKKKKKKVFSCFDTSHDGRLLTVGTETCDGDAFVLFWDLRKVKVLGGYWESHTDDITQVKFNPNSDSLISGSTDGLINVYDLNQSTENDALTDTFNTESSVEQLVWFKNNKNKDCVCCITHTFDVQLWKMEDAEAYSHFRRSDIVKAMKQNSEAHCFVAGAHQCSPNEVLILSGSTGNNNLKSLTTDKKQLVPVHSLKENKQIVRSSWYNEHLKILLTGGEDGILNVWSL